ncbi:MAG TPA: caspase family protein [Polyangia bacterium]|nr:caspase family protein [Polyangia bacterium]
MRTLGGCFAIVAALFLYAFAGAPAHAWSKPPEPRLRRFALIVSANDGGPGRVPLRFADSDAVSVADVLRKLGGLRDDDMILLTGARRAAFQSAFERMRAAIAAAGTVGRRELIVYYAGHSDEQGLLLGGERVGYSELRQWLDGAGAEVRIAILDSCASGSLIRLRGGALRPSFLRDASTNARGHAFLTSSSADEAAQESDRIGSAFFTHYLLSGLRGAADTSRDGLVTLAEAYQFAFNETLGRTEKSGAGPQHPAYDIQLAGTGDLVLTDLRATGATLFIDEKIAGRLYVRDGAGRLLVELRKEPVYPVQLGLGAGKYHVTVDADGRAFETNVTLEDGKVTRLSLAELVQAPLAASPAVKRGDAVNSL